MTQTCAICNSAPAKACASCHAVAYCSTECQQTDWPVHKTICRQFKGLSFRPSPSKRLVLVFPVDSKVPQLKWVECEEFIDRVGEARERLDIKHLLGSGDPVPESKRIGRSKLRGITFNYTVNVVCRDAFLIDGSKSNDCVTEVTGGLSLHDWRGPIIVTSQVGTDVSPKIFQDVTARDLRIAVDYFTSYGDESIVGEDAPQRSPGDKVQGVKITCLGDQKILGAWKYMSVDVPSDHSVFILREASPIAKLLGLEIFVCKYPLNKLWKEHRESYENPGVEFLQIDADPKSDSWGSTPEQWKGDLGSVVVVRADRKPIAPRQIESLCEYCKIKLQPAFEDEKGGKRTKEEVLNLMTKEVFKEFFYEFRREKAKDDPTWNAESLPYDT